MILGRIFCRRSFNMKDSGIDSAMDSDSDLMMMDSGVDSETDSSVEDSVEDSGVDSGMDLMKSQKVAISLRVLNTFCKNYQFHYVFLTPRATDCDRGH